MSLRGGNERENQRRGLPGASQWREWSPFAKSAVLHVLVLSSDCGRVRLRRVRSGEGAPLPCGERGAAHEDAVAALDAVLGIRARRLGRGRRGGPAAAVSVCRCRKRKGAVLLQRRPRRVHQLVTSPFRRCGQVESELGERGQARSRTMTECAVRPRSRRRRRRCR